MFLVFNVLHIINKNIFENAALSDCINVVDNCSVILLIEDAVYSAIESPKTSVFQSLPEDVLAYVLLPDLEVRGIELEQCFSFIKTVDYQGFVQLVADNNPVRSWF
ncbi:MAG: sulfurtransferase complex subunit TusB [Piscirickettsiaceae bacterium]|nr:MAG: sulfurtransferase complex subunit TusB [Piscirickettsiaceae bacterium]